MITVLAKGTSVWQIGVFNALLLEYLLRCLIQVGIGEDIQDGYLLSSFLDVPRTCIRIWCSAPFSSLSGHPDPVDTPRRQFLGLVWADYFGMVKGLTITESA